MILRAWWAGRTPAAGARRPRASEFVWIALPVLVLAATLAFTWRARSGEPDPNEPAHVHAGAAS